MAQLDSRGLRNKLVWWRMTEQQWLECDDPQKLLKLIQGRASERKYVLFALACCHLPPAYNPGYLERVKESAAEYAAAVDFVDGRIGVAEVRRWWLREREEQSWPERGREWAENWVNPLYLTMEDPLEDDLAEMVREVFGMPFRRITVSPAWQTPQVLALANQTYDERAFDRLPLLADALEDAGCNSTDLLSHLRRRRRPHVVGCWALDAILGKK